MDASSFHRKIAEQFNLSLDMDIDSINQIGELVLQGVLIKSLTDMNETQAQALESLEESGAEPGQIVSFLKTALPNFDGMIQDEILNVKKDLGKTDMV